MWPIDTPGLARKSVEARDLLPGPVLPADVPCPADSNARGLPAEILAYWVRHPEAQDTAEGIALWWVPAAAISAVEEAVESLAQAGWIDVRVGKDGNHHYRLNRDRIPAVAIPNPAPEASADPSPPKTPTPETLVEPPKSLIDPPTQARRSVSSN